MRRQNIIKIQLAALFLSAAMFTGCMTSAKSMYFGKTSPPSGNTLRYISGSEPESLDPQVGTGQPEARVYMALYEGLVEYEPKTMEPVPEIAERWEISKDGTEYIFYLRKNAKWSNGDPLTAHDFAYTFRRGFDPANAFRNSNLGYYIKYAEPFNTHSMFMKNANGEFLLKKDFTEANEGDVADQVLSPIGPETEFSKLMRAPTRLSLNGEPLKRAQEIQRNEKLKEAFKFSARDIKNPAAFALKINNGSDPLSAILKQNIAKNDLGACGAEGGCTDANKQAIADGLNKAADGTPLYDDAATAGLALSEDGKAIVKAVKDENKKREDANKALDEALAQMTDETEKAAKEKQRRKPLATLFYANRFLLEQVYSAELEKAALVEAKSEDVGVEAIDDYTFRITLTQPAPFFLDLLPHQFFRAVPQKAIEKFGKAWTRPENIVTCGPFKVKTHRQYDILQVDRDPNYWDAANVKLDGIDFYPMEEQTTMLNLYKSGNVDALYNHTVPASWVDEVQNYTNEYLKHPEVANEYYSISVKKPPMDNVKVRKAFSMAVDREAMAKFRRTTTALYDFTPENIFPKYEEARKKIFEEERVKKGISKEDWDSRNRFNPEKACNFMEEAGYKVVRGEGGKCVVQDFPVEKVNVNYNTIESNRQIAEFIQAQWKQNLGITVPLKNMEWKTFLPYRSQVEYQGFARNGWVGDYMDPFTFLNLFYSEQNDGATGWYDPKYDALLDQANKTLDPQARFEMMARAEFMILDNQLVLAWQTQSTNWVKKPYVKGLYPNPGTLHAWKHVYIERDPAKWDVEVQNIMKKDAGKTTD